MNSTDNLWMIVFDVMMQVARRSNGLFTLCLCASAALSLVSITFAKILSMKKLLSTSYSAGVFNFAMLVLRVSMGALMLPHGYDKLVHFVEYKKHFMNFLGIGSGLTLALVIFAEFFCSMFLIVGLFSRLVAVPLAIGVFVALWKAHHFDVFGDGEKAALFLAGFITILLVGPGKASVDGLVGK